MQNPSLPIAAENWFESHILRPWIPSVRAAWAAATRSISLSRTASM